MLGQRSEEKLLEDLEVARLRHRQALLYLREVIDLCERPPAVMSAGARAAALQSAMRKLDNAGEVYDMALLQLMDYLRRARIQMKN